MAYQKNFSLLVFLLFHLAFILARNANADSLELGFYKKTCPTVETIVQKITAANISSAPSLAAALLRLYFHDCFVRIKGTYWPVPLGRRDGRVSIADESLTLPPFDANIDKLKAIFASKGLSGHTIGISHCSIIASRLYNFTGKGDTDPSLDEKYVPYLKSKCKPTDKTTQLEMDPGSVKTFDESYYTNVLKRRGLFGSDAALITDYETRAYVKLQAQSHGSTFFKDFQESMVKMGQIEVLTGSAGEIRRHCNLIN
ncbi:hypothetical protein L1987_58192 [Smallanthus sonchifolius]|uniref:Uncharacterized protein n=1 Tax=Smallanthus sonchifolius TaxID=185202 RepID=A0ACB9DF91_9ASTR|nr:hypothetical protein L1987_58192 [Smallanthus sonchifolius]